TTAEMTRRADVLKTTLASVDIAICPSEFLLNTYHNRGFSAQQMQFIRQGLRHIPNWPVQKNPSSKIRVGYIGQLAPHKGVHVLVDAFCRLPDLAEAELTIYGDPGHFAGYAAQLRAAAAERLDIHFSGSFDNAQVSQVYRNLDVLVVPSIWYENSPNTILEAFAHQTPVITSNLGGMAELVAHQKTGLLFTPGSATDLADKLSTVLANPALLAGWRQNIQPPKSLPQEMEELEQVYRTLGEGVAAYVG
ncbi:MAG: glycosyltransferase, partial [Chloroflexi bacterium]